MPKITTIAEAMAARSAKVLKNAQELGMECRYCGQRIQMFCCGETLPLTPKDRARAEMEYGKLWTNGDAELLSKEMCALLQQALLMMEKEKITEIRLHADGYVQCER